ncbi:hypothetical protein [Anaerococcus prevotii]|uniref:Conserved domain protein n=1 Tax=Anaerococcus prevotii ACS-065-V-Col13 TaxID=879305 RepID=F0GXD4_9FIRM|nr:hypothetical protein [Anaerococcus prevotii]EGC81542.1 conserved domain protein [Anaerococcus prevotii ACS-065-V-Col13]
MDINFKNQILNDFSITEGEFDSGKNIFSVNDVHESFLFYNKYSFSIIISSNRIFVRSNNSNLISSLRNEYSDYPAQWFTEFENIKKLESILNKYNMKIDNFFPLMTFSDRYVKTKNFEFNRIDKNDIQEYKGISKMPFTFDEDDRIGLSFNDNDKLIALCGASTIGKYLWSIGIEKFCFDKKYEGVSSSIVRSTSLIIKNENPEISPIYTTQFSHIASINTAIRSGFDMNVCICGSKI